MRKHPLLAFVTAIVSCSIPGAVTAVGASTITGSPSSAGQASALTVKAVAATKAHRRANARHNHLTRAEVEARAKARIAALAKVRSRAKARAANVRPYVALGGVWLSLRSCESHNNYTEDSGNGYYGAYQFSRTSWLTVGETGLPSAASPAVQDAAARALLARQGWRAWPTCSWKIGVA